MKIELQVERPYCTTFIPLNLRGRERRGGGGGGEGVDFPLSTARVRRLMIVFMQNLRGVRYAQNKVPFPVELHVI